MEQIKDQQRLFEKLFVSPSSDNHSQLMLSMQFLKLLLEESQQLTLPAQKALLLELLRLFHRQPANSLLLYKHDELAPEHLPLLSLLVHSLARVIRTSEQIDELLPLLGPLVSFYPVGLLHISSITRELSLQFHQGTFNSLRAKFYHGVLERYYAVKQSLDASPPALFFFYGNSENSVIHAPDSTRIPIKNELAIVLTFRTLEAIPGDVNLLWIATNHESLALKVGRRVGIENQTTGQALYDDERVHEGQWHCLIVNLTPSETTVHLNGEEVIRERKGLIRKEKERQIREYTLGDRFTGFVSSLFVLDKAVNVEQFREFGSLQRWRQVIQLNENKLQSSVAVSCLPYSTFELREATHCFDVFRKSHSIIGENIAHFQNPLVLGIAYLGTYDLLLPLFYLARFYPSKEYPDHLEKLLKMWLVALESYKDPENLDEFLIILGHHLESLPSLLTDQCVTHLAAIYERLNASNRIRFLRHVGWSGLPGKAEGSGVRTWLEWLTRLYQNKKSECLRSYGLMDVVFWLVKYLENNEQHCCPEHYINEARALREFSFDELRKIEESTKKLHFEAVENIAAVILEYAIIDHSDQAVRAVKGVLRLLLHKYSNCLYFTILKILKRQIAKFRNDKEVAQILLAANILPFLAALAEKVVDHSLLSLILYLMLFVSQFQETTRAEIVEFYSIVFRRLKEIHQQHFNLLSHGARKVRKRSLDDSSSNSHPLSTLLARLRQYRSSFGEMKFLLLNSCLGVVEDAELSKQAKFVDEKGFLMLKHFLPLAEKTLRTETLSLLRDKLLEHPANSEFCQGSTHFTRLLLEALEESAGKDMLEEIIESQLRRKVNLGEYYILLKNVSRSQIRTADVLCGTFTRLFTKGYKFTLTQFYQILLIMTNEVKDQEQPEGYWPLLALIVRNISLTLKYHLLHSSVAGLDFDGLELVGKIRALELQVLHGAHFDMEIYNTSEEEVNFLFDILLPKLIAGISVTCLLEDIKRTVYIFEIFLYQAFEAIQRNPHHRQDLVSHLVETVLLFISASITRPEEETDKSFLRMVLFFTSYFLLKEGEVKPVLLLWNFIVSFLRRLALDAHAQSYSQLRAAFEQQAIQPFFVEIFEIFLRANNEEYLIPFESLMALSDPDDAAAVITEKVFPILQKQEFAAIFGACRKNAFDKLYLKYQESIMIQQAKWDMEATTKQHTLFQAVERIFEQESIGEEETRLKYLHEHENYLRQYHSSWNELWKRLRSYHHPFGIFEAQKNSQQAFTFASDRLKNYRFKTSKYSSASGIQPILEVEILEPWHVRKTLQQDSKNELNNLVELMRPNQAKPKKTAGVIDSFTSFFRKISGEKGPKGYTEYEVLWVKQGRKARGKLTINDKEEIVFWYESLKQADSHLAFERFSLLFNETMVKSWRVDCIRKVFERRYLMQYHALEIVLLSRKSLLFYFEDKRSGEFLEELQKIRANKLQMLGAKIRLNRVPFYLDDWFQIGLSPKTTEDWRNRKISTLEYLVAVNRAASRGIYDISQYPVLPWVCEMRDEKQPTLRDLTKTMGGLGSEERKRIVAEKYASSDPFNPVPPFHFGTHYSSPGVVFNFLIRVAPFTDYCKNLQGGKFDIPDRLFSSLLQAWRSASTQVSDVRELVPEFYYMPECLLNLEGLHLGETQSGETVNHVELPPWAAHNPYFFTTQMRQMLESDDCSSFVHHWIDFLFGVKQRGEAARLNYNIYYYLTYEEYSDCLAEADEVYRKSCEAQIVHFGQIPPQIFEKEHPKRLPRPTEPVELRVGEKIQLMNHLKEKLIGAHRSGNELTLIKRNAIEVLSLAKSPAVLTRNVEFNFERTISKLLFGIKKEEGKVVFFRQYFLVYGYLTNEFRIFAKATGALEFDESLTSRIEHVVVSEDEALVLVGCRSGMLYIYEIEYEASRLSLKRIYSEAFMHPITHISERDGFYTISFGCYVSIYKFERSLHFLSKDACRPFVRFFRSFRNSLLVRGAFLADIPLYCLVLFDKANVKIYSINGQLIKTLSCNPKRLFPLRDRELNSLFCVVEDARLLLLSTPDLRCISELEVGGSMQVLEEMVIYEKAIHFIRC